MSRLLCGALLACALATEAGAATWYVDKDSAARTPDGTSWAKAFTRIQDGINAASSGGEVWVAEGVYAERRDNTDGALLLKPSVKVYGGFAGNETQLSQRNGATHPTVIDGTDSRSGNRAYHVVVGALNARLDSFFIKGGSASGTTDARRRGGGLYCASGGMTVAYCSFDSLLASAGGGAIYAENALLTVVGCTFTNNVGTQKGGALWLASASGTAVSGSVFTGNRTGQDGTGGAVQCDSTTASFQDCTFATSGARTGGAVYNTGSSPTFTKCLFDDNAASRDGGAVAIESGSPDFTACAFVSNYAGSWSGSGSPADGGAVWRPGSSSDFINCAFQGNGCSRNGGAIYLNAAARITNCTFSGNRANALGGSVYNYDAAPAVKNSILWGNSPNEITEVNRRGTVTYSDVSGGYTGTGNINVSPRFLSVGEGTNRLRLRPGSACLDKGTSVGAPATDMVGTSRNIGSGVDMGAFEGPTCGLTMVVTGPGVVTMSAGGVAVPMSQAGTYYQYLPYNLPVSLTATAATRARFIDWRYGDTTDTRNPLSFRMLDDYEVRAAFKPEYTLTVAVVPAGSGSVTPGAGTHTYVEGAQVAVSATPAAGWQFDHWEGALSGATPQGTVTMTADRSVTAVFVRTVALTIAASEGGTTTPAPNVYVHPLRPDDPVEVTVTAKPNAQWRLDHWEGDASGSAASVTVPMDRDRAVTAVFAQIPRFTLTIGAAEGGSTTPAAGTYGYDAYPEVQTVAISAVAADNWRFVGWSGDVSGGTNPVSLAMDRNRSVTPVFERIPLQILESAPAAALPVGGTGLTLRVQSWTEDCRVYMGGELCRTASVQGKGIGVVRVIVPAMAAGSYPLRVLKQSTQEETTAGTPFAYVSDPFDDRLPVELNSGLEIDDGNPVVGTFVRRVWRSPAGFPSMHFEGPGGITFDVPGAALPAAADGAFVLVRFAAQHLSLFANATPLPEGVVRTGIVDWHLFLREPATGGPRVYEMLDPLPQAARIGFPLTPGPEDAFVVAGFGTGLSALFGAVPPDPPDYVETESACTVGAGHVASVAADVYGTYLVFGNPPPEDINQDGRLDATDVQLVVNGALGLDIGGRNADIDGDTRVNAYDVQVVINLVLGYSR